MSRMKSLVASARSAQAALTVATLALMSGAALAAAPAPAFKADAAKGQQLAASCGGCHTQDGSRGLPTNPILAAQHPEYITKQLVEFKSGKRKNAIMSGMAAALSEEDMKHIAAYYSGLTAKPGFARAPKSVALGEQIYRGGIAAKAVPACAGCHSPNGAGIPSQYPRLSGQHAEYAEAQLLAFRSGERGNNAQMMAISAKLSDAEMKAVADYLAGLR